MRATLWVSVCSGYTICHRSCQKIFDFYSLTSVTSKSRSNQGRICQMHLRQWRRQKFSFGVTAQGLSRESEGRSPPEAEAVCRHCLQSMTAKTIKIWKCRTKFTPDSWPVCFTAGDKATFAGLSLKLMMPPLTCGANLVTIGQ